MNPENLVQADTALVGELEKRDKRGSVLEALREYIEANPQPNVISRSYHTSPDGTVTTKEIISPFVKPSIPSNTLGLLSFKRVQTFRKNPKLPNRQRTTELHGRQKVRARKTARRIAKLLSED